MKILKKVLIVIAVLIVIILGYAATKPDTYHVERSVDINATPQEISGLIGNFNNFQQWSPFEKYDPEMKKTISDNPGGVGAFYEWDGNSQVGNGRMEITKVAADRIDMNVDFIAPMKAHNTAYFTMEPEGTATKVTWAMDGEYNYIAKVMCIFIDMDAMVGGDFENGLQQLKTVAEQ